MKVEGCVVQSIMLWRYLEQRKWNQKSGAGLQTFAVENHPARPAARLARMLFCSEWLEFAKYFKVLFVKAMTPSESLERLASPGK